MLPAFGSAAAADGYEEFELLFLTIFVKIGRITLKVLNFEYISLNSIIFPSFCLQTSGVMKYSVL
jgi:hypothetical protein